MYRLQDFKFRLKNILKIFFRSGISFHKNESVRPFFIVGSGRCGTTLLRRILTANEGIHIPPENWALSRIIRKFNHYRFFDDWDTIVDLTVAAHCYGTQGWFEQFPVDFVETAKSCDDDERSLSWLMDSLYRYQAKITGNKCTRWGDKTPLNVNNMEIILKVFPKAQFIHMLRDGVDVVNSWKKHGYYGDDLIKPANRWISALKAVEKFRKKYPNKIIEVRYESLTKNPEEKTKKVCDFLDIPFNERIFKIGESSITEDLKKYSHYKNALKPISDKHIGKGREALKREQLEMLDEEFNETLMKVGYERLY